jgi:hypothetical protein
VLQNLRRHDQATLQGLVNGKEMPEKEAERTCSMRREVDAVVDPRIMIGEKCAAMILEGAVAA